MRYLLVLLLLSGCGSRYTLVDSTALAANLKQPCPSLTPLTAGDGKTILRWATATVDLYEDCRVKHQELVNAITQKAKP